MGQQMPPQYGQQYPPQLPKQWLEYQQAALWLIIGAWVLGFFGWILNLTIIGAILGIPMVVAAFAMHIVGIVFIAMIRCRP
jgi:hypothetical protein